MTKPDLRALRAERGWSQMEAAQRIGIQAPMLSGYETGKHEPIYKTMIKICAAYEIEPWMNPRPYVPKKKNALALWITANANELHLSLNQIAKETNYGVDYIAKLACGQYLPVKEETRLVIIIKLAELFAKKRLIKERMRPNER